MRALRWAGASLLTLLAGLLGLVGIVLCATLILLPLGIPILFVAKRLFRTAGQLFVPRAVRHPVEESQKRAGRGAKRLGEKAKSKTKSTAKSSKKLMPGQPSRSTRLRQKLHLT